MKLLLTSGGITNNSIRNALVDMMGKPIAEATALFVPTAEQPLGPFFVGRSAQNLLQQEWKAFGVLELTALPSIPKEAWLPHLRAADALLVGGGDPLYLCYWMQQSGLADLLPSPELRETVYVGMSAGSMVLAPNIGQEFVEWRPPAAGDTDSDSNDDKTLGLVDFAMFPHLDNPDLPKNTLPVAEKWAAKLTVPGYAVDDDTASKVIDGSVEVVSEGHWELFTP
ncbi:MAG: Type 1 glutamine amidotransferase-like domain-containing protein [Chloroflexota bacterium]|nr:Type 1 glutamine amidotransferase-like domain-containing protein [Chloroflexota bacterium]